MLSSVQSGVSIDEYRECYDYGTPSGRAEIDNETVPGGNATLCRTLQQGLEAAIETEFHQPLPAALQPAQQEAFQAYLAWEETAS